MMELHTEKLTIRSTPKYSAGPIILLKREIDYQTTLFQKKKKNFHNHKYFTHTHIYLWIPHALKI